MTSEYKGITNDQAAFAALGVFDGVHTGHRAVIEKVKEEAAMRNLSSAVISFRTHPQQVLHPEIPFRMLTSPEERAELLRKTGIDRTIFLDFTPEMSLLSAYDFLKILSNRYCIKGLIIGYDHRFGHNRAEGFEEYVKYVLVGMRGKKLIDDYAANITLEYRSHVKGAQKDAVENEIDAAFSRNSVLYLIECKTSDLTKKGKATTMAADAIYKLDSLKKSLGGSFGRGMVVSVFEPREEDKKRAEELRLRLVFGARLLGLEKEICQWIAN